MLPALVVPGVGEFPRRTFLVGLIVCGYRLIVPTVIPTVLPILVPALIPLVLPVAHAAVIPVPPEPRGPGICAPLEGGISCAEAMAALGAAWAMDYQPVTTGTPMIRSQHYTPEGSDGSVGGPWWARVLAHKENPAEWTIALNEPHSASQDNLPAAEAARMLREDFVERIVVYDPARKQGQAPRVLPVNWVGLNVMIGLGSSRQWLRDYIAAGGVQPALNGAHAYATTGNGLRALTLEWLAYLATMNWHNPLILSEVGSRPIPFGTPPANPDDTVSVLRAAFDLLREGVIAGFAWFASIYNENQGAWSANNLLRSDGSLTDLGLEYRRLATGVPLVGGVKSIYFPVAGR